MHTPTRRNELPSWEDLYWTDLYSWSQGQVRALRDRDADYIDWKHVIEEIDSLGREKAHALQGHYANAMEHFLKLQHREDKAWSRRSWKTSVENARNEIREILLDNPGLKNRRDELFATAWKRARARAVITFAGYDTERIQDEEAQNRERKTRREKWSRILPEPCPYTRDQVENLDWWPDPPA